MNWSPSHVDGSGDVAVLRLDTGMSATVPALRRVEALWGRSFRTVGFPPGREDGVWAAGELRDTQGAGWVQLCADGGSAVGPGFSGAPIWDHTTGSVVAMAVAADREPGAGSAAYALPVANVLSRAPEVRANPYRGLAAFGEEDAEFFFGRDDDITRCVAVLRREGMLVVAGPSGAGKSSLLDAGVAAAERVRGVHVARARLTGASDRDDVARRWSLRWRWRSRDRGRRCSGPREVAPRQPVLSPTDDVR